jgi:hypothetical protein
MKKWTVFILYSAVLLAFTACKPDAPLKYNTTDGVYFNAGSDSVLYSFAKYPNRLLDTIKIPVFVLGKPAPKDREVTVVSVPGGDANAVEGTHYRLVTPLKIPANSVTGLLPVVVYRTGDLDSTIATLKLQLKENANFGLGIEAQTSIKVKVGYLQKPATWGDFTGIYWAGKSTNFGTWTKTKYKLILDALYNPVADASITEFPLTAPYPTSYPQYLQIVKNYIRTQYPGNFSTPVGQGATLRDPDVPNNPVIQVGPANY